MMQDLLIDHDEQIISLAIQSHPNGRTDARQKRGTGGAEGVGYLMTTLSKKFFPEIWEARTHRTI
ncbi:MAG: hypothetical protein IPK98_10965 [Chloracidobacterium sp.]|nr:hypothetical protein [Chloracidobacterium sp.]